MTDKLADVSSRHHPGSPTSESNIVGHQSDIGHQHFLVQFSDAQSDVVLRRQSTWQTFRPISAADILGPVFRHSGGRRTLASS